MTSTALAIVPAAPMAALVPASISECEAMAKMLSESTLVPDDYRGKPRNIYMAISYGLEIGLPPVTALMSIAVIKGKPSLYAASMVALVHRSGKAEYFHCVESDAKHAIYETKRIGDAKPRRYEFNESMAKAASLLGGMYSKYPQQMYEARAKAYLAKDVYSDVLHGLSSYEEIAASPSPHIVDVSEFEEPVAEPAKAEPPRVIDTTEATASNDVEKPEVEPEPAAEAEDDDTPSLIDLMLTTKTEEELDGLLPQFKGLKGKPRETAIAVYRKQKETLKAAK